ncbi:MAG: winged helix-turn-helix domain-containing protein [Candidatus Bathyarchaeia archaeon]
MISKRSRLELYLEVLRAISKGVGKPTNIMYRCNLSWTNCKEILEFLTEQGLITVIENNNRRFYKLTENGRGLLENLNKIQCLFTVAKGRGSQHFNKLLLYPTRHDSG